MNGKHHEGIGDYKSPAPNLILNKVSSKKMKRCFKSNHGEKSHERVMKKHYYKPSLCTSEMGQTDETGEDKVAGIRERHRKTG